jgi:hypothetical protein
MKFSDSTILTLVQLLQVALLTGTDIVDNFRTIVFEEVDSMLNITDSSREVLDNNIKKMLEEVEQIQKKDE